MVHIYSQIIQFLFPSFFLWSKYTVQITIMKTTLRLTLNQTSWASTPYTDLVCLHEYYSHVPDSLGILKYLLENCTSVLLYLQGLYLQGLYHFFPSSPSELK